MFVIYNVRNSYNITFLKYYICGGLRRPLQLGTLAQLDRLAPNY